MIDEARGVIGIQETGYQLDHIPVGKETGNVPVMYR
jgi:hypothetical protein